ncbi:MAG: VOC family protein [Phycisphaerae bacterium]
MELEPGNPDFVFRADTRPNVPEPPPVRLAGIDDVRTAAPAEAAGALVAFYTGLLGFWRLNADDGHEQKHRLTFRAQNADLVIDLKPVREAPPEMRATGVIVPSLSALQEKLREREIPFVFDQGLAPGEEVVTLRDPAGNWLAVRDSRQVS